MREKSVVDCILTMNIIHFVILYHSLGVFFRFCNFKSIFVSIYTYYTNNFETCCESIHGRIK